MLLAYSSPAPEDGCGHRSGDRCATFGAVAYLLGVITGQITSISMADWLTRLFFLSQRISPLQTAEAGEVGVG